MRACVTKLSYRHFVRWDGILRRALASVHESTTSKSTMCFIGTRAMFHVARRVRDSIVKAPSIFRIHSATEDRHHCLTTVEVLGHVRACRNRTNGVRSTFGSVRSIHISCSNGSFYLCNSTALRESHLLSLVSSSLKHRNGATVRLPPDARSCCVRLTLLS